jgi:cytochrome c oxidase subunit 3
MIGSSDQFGVTKFMATTVHEPPKIGDRSRLDERKAGGGGSRGSLPGTERLRTVEDGSTPASRTGVWVGIAAISMSFAAFTSAMVVRQGGSSDWRHLVLPRVLYLNTLILMISSSTLEVARRRFRRSTGTEGQRAGVQRALFATFALGLLFIAGQYMAWLQLKAQGLYLATNPSSSFFYVFTAIHGLHVLGGMAGLLYVIGKVGKSALRRGTLDATSHYWHFMDVLWLYLLWVLWMKL